MLRLIRGLGPEVDQLIDKQYGDLKELEARTAEIVAAVKRGKDTTLLELAKRFDSAELSETGLRVSEAEIDEAYRKVDGEFVAALKRAKASIENFHRKQLRQSWLEPDEKGSILGQLIRPLERVGIYVPGGTAAYPSSVLMNAVPAKVAGVAEVVMVTPVKGGNTVTPEVLVAAREAGVDEIYKVGGAQAIAALAYGTESIKKVDKITGPGNIYVTLAKKMVYGEVDIDMLAGPSEILVVADNSADPAYVAADLLSQAEHDTLASAILVTDSEELLVKVSEELESQLGKLPRRDIAETSLVNNGAAILVDSLEEGIAAANKFAPEHLELMIEEPFRYLGQIKNAGAIFMGKFSPEPLGDYFAGPNHVLPTGGTARFYSPLNIDTFTKKMSVIAYSETGLRSVARDVIKLAETEGLDAHAAAIKVRVK
ncbi:MAG TPA: histidinol dehydrogenase [Verrucomicrobiae bacterium]|nr:histidinol dehydrogenase [Verrucomicrobiae bacterium]